MISERRDCWGRKCTTELHSHRTSTSRKSETYDEEEEVEFQEMSLSQQ